MSSDRVKTLSRFDMVLFTFCAVFVIDTIPASASIGASTIFWWLFIAVFFFLPYGLITAELGTTYPEQGGLYVWVKRAFGQKWAARTTWYYWVNVALWMPSVYIMFAGILSRMFFPNMPLWVLVVIGIALTWITVLLNIQALSIAKWIPNTGAIAKMVVVLALVIAMVYYLSTGHPFQNPLNMSTMRPTFDAGLAFLPAIVYNFCGFELMNGAGDEMKNPKRDVPRAVITSGVLITVFYLITTLAILAVMPLNDVSLINGIVDTLYGVFGATGLGGALVITLGLFVLFTFLANMVTWSLGANRSAVEAANSGEMPKVFGTVNARNQAPLGASLLAGVTSTAVIVVYGLMASSAESLFWSIFAFSSIVFLLPYAIIFPAFLRLRQKDKAISRPYKVPGPAWFTTTLAVLAEFFIIQGIVFFAWVPGQPVDWMFTLSVVIGTIIVVAIGEWIIQTLLGRRTRSGPKGKQKSTLQRRTGAPS